jgi:hypothetical protein
VAQQKSEDKINVNQKIPGSISTHARATFSKKVFLPQMRSFRNIFYYSFVEQAIVRTKTSEPGPFFGPRMSSASPESN